MEHDVNHNHANMTMPMPMTFSTSTKVTLFFSTWTTTSSLLYTLTLLVLFFLAFLSRFLAALRFQLDHSLLAPPVVPNLAPARARRAIPKARLSPLPRYIQVDEDEVGEGHLQPCEPDERGRLGPDKQAYPAFHTRVWTCLVTFLPNWTANAQWSWRGDGGRALLEGVRAFTGYSLMLAVMTFNTGVFGAVLGGIIVGEMVLSRFMHRSFGMSHDGGCHDG
ncbi:Ctr copper transporter [Aspergillus aurantiobrunneus]